MDLFCTQILKKQFFVKIRNLDVIVISLYVVALVSQNTIVLIILASGSGGFSGWGRDVAWPKRGPTTRTRKTASYAGYDSSSTERTEF